jgi:lipopolysaccharide export system permease protein
MRKLDSLILRSFIGPFILTFVIVVFILLMVQMLRHFDDIIGKDLGFNVIGQLLFYFAIFTSPTALPLAVLLSCLTTFGNLGEHFELTAIKSAGISLTRTYRSILVVVIGLTILAFCVNNYLVPKAALRAYSLIFDIKQKKPALDLQEGVFYDGLNDVSIKVDRKFTNDAAALKGVVLYDHRKGDGNRDVIKADSGRMSTVLNERYLKVELFNGYNYREGQSEEHDLTGKKNASASEPFTRSSFEKTQMIFDLSSFDFVRNSAEGFSGIGMMRNMRQLQTGMDSLHARIRNQRLDYHRAIVGMNSASQHSRTRPSIELVRTFQTTKLVDSLFASEPDITILQSAGNRARQIRSHTGTISDTLDNTARELRVYAIQWHKILASSFACLVMFLIGAPLGSIIRKGGIGVPFLISILFFIIYFVLTMQFEKLARQDTVDVSAGAWTPDLIFLVAGLYFLRQARLDARVFDADAYQVLFGNLRPWLLKKGLLPANFNR